MLALDAKTGAVQWEHKTGVGIMNTVVPLSANRVLATDFDGKIMLVEAGRALNEPAEKKGRPIRRPCNNIF